MAAQNVQSIFLSNVWCLSLLSIKYINNHII